MSADAQRCWNCSFENLAGAKYCSNCGVALGTAGTPGDAIPLLAVETRKVVTILFADLVGSTALTERLDPEEAREVVGKFYRVVQHTVERFGGSVANLLGDAVLAVFGLPAAHEDDPERAVRAALAMGEALPGLNEQLQATRGLTLSVRVGINTGEVVAASGSTFDRDFLISDAVTTAARLQQTVAPGTVVVGARTYRLTRDAIVYRPLPPLEVKGKSAALVVWEAVAPLPERAETGQVAAPLIGRQGELSILRSLYDRCRDEGLVHLATILGQPGVGKSRLVREFLAEARDAGPAPMVLRGRSIAFGERIGYHALIDILRAQAELMDTDSAATLRDKLEAWVRAHLPEHVSLLDGLLLTFGGGTTREGDPEQLRRRLLETWKTLLKRLAARRTVIVAFEDLHWADDGVFDLIQAIVEDPESAPVLVICVGRPELLERRPAWGTGWRNALVIDLKPLRPSEADRLVEVLSGPRLTRDVRQVVAQRAGGNPLFAEELVRMLVEGNGDRPAAPEGTIPDTVQAVLTARVDRLPVPERRALQAAAVIGRAFWSGAVAVLAGMSNEEASSAVDGLTARELIIRRPASTIADQGEFAFRHSLARDVAYGLLPRSQRQRAHAQAARWLEAQFGDRTEEAVEVLAEHWRLAGDDARAAEYLLRAANKARRLYANTTALHLYDLALESAERARLQATSAAQVRLGRGEVHQHLGAYAPAMADFEAGLSLAQRAGDRALEATFEHRVGFIHHREARLDPAEAHFARAVALARSAGERLTLGAALIDLATIAWDRGQVDPHRATLTEGIGLLRDAGDRSNLARALNLLCMARYAAGDTTGAIAAAEDAIANAREAGDKSREATSLSYLSVVLGWGGRPREGIRYARAARDLGEAIGDRRRVAYAVIFMVQASYEVGDWGDGIRLQEEHLDLARGLTPAELPFALLTLGQLYYEVGDDARARANLHAGISLATANPAWLKWQHMAAIYLAMVNADRDALQRAADELVRLPGGFVPLDAASVLPCGEALVRLGRHDDLRRLVERDRPMIARYGSAAFLAGLAILDADLAMHAGQPALAARHLDQALAHSKAAENAPLLRLTLERRIRYFNDDTDRGALRVLLERLAGSLPDDLRQTFLASPRVAPFLASEAAHG